MKQGDYYGFESVYTPMNGQFVINKNTGSAMDPSPSNQLHTASCQTYDYQNKSMNRRQDSINNQTDNLSSDHQ